MTYRELVLDIIKNADLDQEVSVLVGKRHKASGATISLQQVQTHYIRLMSQPTGIRIDADDIDKAEPITNF